MNVEDVISSTDTVTSETINITNVSKPPDDNIFTAITQSALGLVGVFGNLCVIIVFLSTKKLRSKIINIYIINQSIIDFIASTFLFLVGFTIKNTYTVELGLRGKLNCYLWKSRLFLWWMYISSTYNIVMMSVERYLEIIHSLWHRAYFTKRVVYVTIFMAWLIGFVVNFTYQLPTSKVENGLCMLYSVWPNALTSQIVGVYLFCVAILIPVFILIFVYGRIAWVLSRKLNNDILTDRADNQHYKKQVDSATVMRMKNYELARRNTLKTLTLVAVCFVICWTGNQVWLLLFNFGFQVDWDSPGYQFLVLMICVNCVINPFIYLIQYKEYQRALQTLLCRKKKTSLNESNTSVTSSSEIQ